MAMGNNEKRFPRLFGENKINDSVRTEQRVGYLPAGPCFILLFLSLRLYLSGSYIF
jgi:hypothetical protein